jgi:hypothetical protein
MGDKALAVPGGARSPSRSDESAVLPLVTGHGYMCSSF